MKTVLLRSAFVLLAAAALAAPSAAQEPEAPARNSFGLRVGYAASSGEWNKVRYAPHVTLLDGGVTVGANVAIALSDRLSLVVSGGYEPLDGSDWEAFAGTEGDIVQASASFVSLGALLRPYLKATGPNLVWVEFGPAVLFPTGEERFNGTLYQYDFFSSMKFGAECAVGFERMLGDRTAVSLRAGALIFPTGVSYADGESFTMIALPVTAGVEISF
jgi:hypothetical protein